MLTLRVCALCALVAGCANRKTSYVDGSFRGAPVPVTAATFLGGPTPQGADGRVAYSLFVELGTDACAAPRTPGSRVLALAVMAPEDFDDGDFTIRAEAGTAPRAWGYAGHLDAGCDVERVEIASGSVTVAAVGGNQAQGSFEVILEDGAHLSGAFEAQRCPQRALAPTCKR